MNAQQTQKVKKYWESITNEPIEVKEIKGTKYGFGSELAVLRLFAKYNANGSTHNEKARVGFSDNLKSWYFELEPAF